MKLYYFEALGSNAFRCVSCVEEVANEHSDQYDAVLKCVRQGGLSSCTHLARSWLDVPVAWQALRSPRC